MFDTLPILALPEPAKPRDSALSLVRNECPQSLCRLGVEHFSLTGPYAPILLNALFAHAKAYCQTPAGLSGYDLPRAINHKPNQGGGRSSSPPNEQQIGSLRVRCHSEELAAILYQALSAQILRFLIDERPEHRADLDEHGHWEFVGVNPLFRFIRYPAKTGTLVAHYDAPYVADSCNRSLYSLLVYLSDCEKGATRFLIDPQARISEKERDFRDWDRVGRLEEVLVSVSCEKGDILVFPHRVLHDSEPNESEKIVMRSDLMFQKVVTR